MRLYQSWAIFRGALFLDSHLENTPASRSKLSLFQAYNPLKIKHTKESALLLAKIMFDARKFICTEWITEGSGSVILTQALKALADSEEELPDHYFFMVNPQSNPDAMLKQAFRVNITVDREYKSARIFSYRGYMNEIVSILRRLREKKTRQNEYGKTRAILDLISSGRSFFGLIFYSVLGSYIFTKMNTAGLSFVYIYLTLGCLTLFALNGANIIKGLLYMIIDINEDFYFKYISHRL
ncbi:hypothetical protein [Marinibactrum halimedae]|uniref:Uncharacterized protein n=1 Tax=Marinibactrum halimedae TaxID=1444977 RepID=A0AA37WNN5_9GAMM|nr:hypothetical protein [Marinibactrum halimedae]MCD9459953.1 hypothetical protein [Marinibactrum halimedae]GLS28279.1 hypothetical protein GCM10007877_39980 [Marinibactrum halimedae]